MQGCDLHTLPADALVLPTPSLPLPYEQPCDEPRLRYDVESMQHWIDLNA
jgi:hypothetical protein